MTQSDHTKIVATEIVTSLGPTELADLHNLALVDSMEGNFHYPGLSIGIRETVSTNIRNALYGRNIDSPDAATCDEVDAAIDYAIDGYVVSEKDRTVDLEQIKALRKQGRSSVKTASGNRISGSAPVIFEDQSERGCCYRFSLQDEREE